MRAMTASGIVLLGLVLLGTHLGVTAALYHATSDVKVETTGSEEIIAKLVESLKSREFQAKLREATDAAAEELAPQIMGELQRIVEGVMDRLADSIPSSQPTSASRPTEHAEVLKFLRDHGVEANSLEWKVIKTPTSAPTTHTCIRQVVEWKLIKTPTSAPVLHDANRRVDLGEISVTVENHIPLAEMPLFHVHRQYHWPTWLIVYLVAGSVAIPIGVAILLARVFGGHRQ